MPRNSSGVYSLYTPGNPVVTGTTISSTWANNTLTDLATAMSDSLSRSGDGGMQAALELAAGTVGTPGLSWTAETTSGLYRAAAGDFRYSVGGADVLGITNAGISVTGTITASTTLSATTFRAGNGTVGAPAFAFTSDTDCGVYRIGTNNIGIAVNGAKVLDVATTGLGVTGTLSSTGNGTVGGTLGVTGATTLSSTLAVSSNATVGGTLGVTGAATLSSSLTANSVLVGAATGGNQGAGTVNATAVYDDGVLLANQTGANPTGTIGLTAVNGSAGTFLRSDGAPALSQSIAPTWTAQHTFTLSGSTANPTVELASTSPILIMRDTNSSANEGIWRTRVNQNAFEIGAVDDARTGITNLIAATRSGAAISSIAFGNSTDNPTYSFLGTGTASFGGSVGITNDLTVFDDATVQGNLLVNTLAGTAANPNIQITSASPNFGLFESDAAANNGLWVMRLVAEQFRLSVSNDAGSATADFMTVGRTANTVDAMTLTATAITLSGTVATGALTSSGVITAPLGAASAPAYTFSGDTNTGIYSSGAEQIDFATSGTLRLSVSTSAFTGTLPWRGQDGSNTAPAFSFSGDTNTGMYRVGSDSLGLTTAGTVRVTVGPGVQVGAPTGGDQGAGTVNATALYDDGSQLFANVPRSTTTTTLVAADLGKCVAVSAAIAIPASVFSAGDIVSIYNDSASAVNITIAAGTLRLAGTTTTGTRSLAARGIATLWFNVGGATPEVIASGNVT